ncbi:gastrula zinc finger protein XlCGF26.1-like [Teleopsis dalmanni]|uniref:gastrula zinc finger protein XlCGF26.1-like n=1 Tax=Teleopsis dalmanni TaxID=139649 RepID=UPI0018CD2EFA|nr:gastrula zinc finger protein XlCGF26.1-like [Teleopsis dalmanni]
MYAVLLSEHTTPNYPETVSSDSVADLFLDCANCNKKFLTLKDLMKHQEMHEAPTFECKHCTVCFTSETELLYHMVKVHKDENDIINEDRLGFNVKDNNNTSMVKHECSICRKCFTKGSSLKSHIRSAHTDEKPFSCSYCFKSFNRKNILNRHIRTHTKTRPALHTHINSSHEDNVVETLLYCSHCQDIFGNEKYLLDHTAAKHKGVKVDYKCDTCEKVFSDLKEYKIVNIRNFDR